MRSCDILPYYVYLTKILPDLSVTNPPPHQERQPDQPGPGFTPAVSSGYGWNDPPPATVAKNAFSRQTNTVNSLPTEVQPNLTKMYLVNHGYHASTRMLSFLWTS